MDFTVRVNSSGTWASKLREYWPRVEEIIASRHRPSAHVPPKDIGKRVAFTAARYSSLLFPAASSAGSRKVPFGVWYAVRYPTETEPFCFCLVVTCTEISLAPSNFGYENSTNLSSLEL